MVPHPLLAHAASSDEIASTLLFFVAVWIGWVAWSRLRDKGFPNLSRTIALALLPVAVVIAIVGAIVPRLIVNAYLLKPGSHPDDQRSPRAPAGLDRDPVVRAPHARPEGLGHQPGGRPRSQGRHARDHDDD